ncbi:MAG TPA: SH3 domain-containing protein [Dehalococcoidia bacterium]|nr:SH3 domain-containing protein [Dehalococcoidia bacterium]
MRLLIVIAAALLLVACSSRVPPPATPTPGPSATLVPVTPAPTQTPVAVPDFLAGVEVRPLQIDMDVGVSSMANLFIELGCTGCEGPTTGFARVFRTSGPVQSEVLLTPEMLPLPPANPDDQRYVNGFGFAPDGSDLIAAVCVHGYCGGMGAITPDAQVWLVRSTDGGITWSDFEHLPRPEAIAGWLGPGSVLTTYIDASGASSFTARPSGQPVSPPVNAPNAWPWVTAAGEVLWHSGEGLVLRADGSTYVATDQDGVSFGKPLRGQQRELLPLSWTRGTDSRYYLAELGSDGSVRRAFSGADGWINPEAWLSPVSDNRIFASVTVPPSRYAPPDRQFVGSLPAIIDLGSATVLPIPNPFLAEPFFNGRNHIVAVQQGPLVRVKDTGDCLNVRAAPVDGEVLECVRDGVLMREAGESAEAGGLTWSRVVTPSGTKGWSAAQYLER